MSGLRYDSARRWETRWKRVADDRTAQTGGDRLLQAALAGFAPLYGAGAWIHRLAYCAGLRRVHRVATPVICVGNLTLGGTGKTPVVAWLVGRLREAGLTAAVVSRGYGGRAGRLKSVKALAVTDGRTPILSPDVAGDEPLELAATLPGTPVVIGRDRAAAARLAEEQFHPDVVILDDGFQNPSLHRNFNLIVIDASRPPSALRRFPRGSLREGLRALRRADAAILTRCDQAPPEAVRALIARLRRRFPHLALAPSIMEPESLSTLENDLVLLPAALEGKRALLFCGVGNPESVRRSVAGLGLIVEEPIHLPDHEAAPPTLLADLRERLRAGEADFLVCTPKDAVKLPADLRNHPDGPVFVVRSRLTFSPTGTEIRLLDHLTRIACRRPFTPKPATPTTPASDDTEAGETEGRTDA